MGVQAPSGRSAATRLVRVLGPVVWLTVLVGGLVALALPGPDDGVAVRTTLVSTLTVFFVVVVVRLVMAAVIDPPQRRSLLLLAAAVVLWAAGSASVSAAQTIAEVTFPAPGEVLCLVAYVGFAGFLLHRGPRRTRREMTIWLEATVVCGAAVCLAAFVVLTPLAHAFERAGPELLLAVLFPVLDLLLATVVLIQVMLRRRARTWSAAALVGGFVALAIADSNFVLRLSNGVYSSSLALDALWGVGFALLAAGACARPVPVVERLDEREHAGLLLGAAALAVAVLALSPAGATGAYVAVPAVITLVATGVRLVLALRGAEGAAEALRLSRTDALTGLPNRRALLAAADAALSGAEPLGFILLDLDGFKDINDSMGHLVGDDVLVQLAHRMRDQIDPAVLVARLGGDEFALLAPGVDDARLFEIAQQVRAALQVPLRIDTLEMSVDASVGLTMRLADDTSSTELLRRADIAMYEAKQSRVGVLKFETTLDGFSRRRLRRGVDLRQAMAADDLEVMYQPQVDARTGQVVAMEALVRWRHPTDGLIAPVAFLPDARRSGLMPALTEVVGRHVFTAARRWADEGLELRVAMNCAPPELVSDQLLARLLEALEGAGLAPESLVVEVTEDAFLADPARAREAIEELRAHAVQVSVDDYGTGHSSLAYLRDLPVQELKIDRSFVSTVTTDARSRLIVAASTQMAHALGLRLVAEGVEDSGAAAALVPLGVDVLQGFHIARPMPAADVVTWVRRWSADRVSLDPTAPGQP